MIFDFLDMENPRDDQYLEANYYERLPKTPGDGPVLFSYEYLDPLSREYAKFMGELRNDNALTAIRTNEDLNWRVGSYVCTQDDQFWQIEAILKYIQSEENREALRIVKQAADTDFVLRLRIKDNPWELK